MDGEAVHESGTKHGLCLDPPMLGRRERLGRVNHLTKTVKDEYVVQTFVSATRVPEPCSDHSRQQQEKDDDE